jgi:hypothetical protein
MVSPTLVVPPVETARAVMPAVPLALEILVPEVAVKVSPEDTVVLPLRLTPPLPDWTVVVEVPLVEPRVVVWLLA